MKPKIRTISIPDFNPRTSPIHPRPYSYPHSSSLLFSPIPSYICHRGLGLEANSQKSINLLYFPFYTCFPSIIYSLLILLLIYFPQKLHSFFFLTITIFLGKKPYISLHKLQANVIRLFYFFKAIKKIIFPLIFFYFLSNKLIVNLNY